MTAPDAATAQLLDRLGPVEDADQLLAEIAEPLHVSAPIAYAIAHDTCQPGGPADDCRAYHAIWQYLRLTDTIRSVRSDGPLFVAAAGRRARAGRLRRVLICGTADYSMLAYLGHAVRRSGAATEFDVLDRCGTTLRMNQWYAERRGLSVRTIAADVMAFEPDRQYDLICAHSFLAWISSASRPLLVARWHDWLVPGGEVCFSGRTDLKDGPPSTTDHAQRVAAMTAEFFERCDALGLDLPADRDTFAGLIRRYGERPLHRGCDLTMDRILAWIGSAGLSLDLAVPVAGLVAGARDKSSMPVTVEGRPRMWFLARRA